MKNTNKLIYIIISLCMSLILSSYTYYKADSLHVLDFVIENNLFLDDINIYERLLNDYDVILSLKNKIDSGLIKKIVKDKTGKVYNIQSIVRKRKNDLSITVKNSKISDLEEFRVIFVEIINKEIKKSLLLQDQVGLIVEQLKGELAFNKNTYNAYEKSLNDIENAKKGYNKQGFEYLTLNNIAIESESKMFVFLTNIEKLEESINTYNKFYLYELIRFSEDFKPKIRSTRVPKIMNSAMILLLTFVSFVLLGFVLFKKK